MIAFQGNMCYDNLVSGGNFMNVHIKTQERNYGIDLLRLVSALYVLVLHVLIHGGLYGATTADTHQNYLCRFLVIFCFPTIDIFGLISGYVGYRDTEKSASLSGYLYLWFGVVFYSVAMCAVYMILFPGSATWTDFLSMFFPLNKNLYWYFSAYSLVYFLSPLLNKFVSTTPDNTLKKYFFLIFFVVVPLEFANDAFAMADGYSAMWLLILYLMGAIMKKTGLFSRISSIVLILGILAFDFAYFYLGTRYTYINHFIFNFSLEPSRTHVMPLYLASAIAHVLVFSRMRFHPILQKVIAFAASAAFFIYIVNVQNTFWVHFMMNRFAHWAYSSAAGLLVRTGGFALVFMTAVVVIDYIRRKLFCLLGVQKWCKKISRLLWFR